MKPAKSILARIWWLGRGTATVVGLAVLLALTVGLASTALAGTGVGARLDLGKVNTVDAVTRLTGGLAGASLAIDNNSTGPNAAALGLRVEPGKAPLKVNAAAGTAPNLSADELDGRDSFDFALRDPETGAAFAANVAQNSDRLDNKDSTQFASGTNGKANDADRLDGMDSAAFFSGKTYNKEGGLVDNPGALRTASAACDAGDAALTGGYRVGSLGAEVEVVSETTFGGTHSVAFVADNTVAANVTCADLPPLR